MGMFEITGKYGTAKVFTDNVDEGVNRQIKEVLNESFIEGSTYYDSDTEVLTKYGWVRMCDFDGNEIAVVDITGGKHSIKTEFIRPDYLIKHECDSFYELKTKYGINMRINEGGCVLNLKSSHHRERQRGDIIENQIKNIFERHKNTNLGYREVFLAYIPDLKIESTVPLDDDDIRVQVMLMADGYLNKYGKCIVVLKKQRKIKRVENLLNKANINFKRSEHTNGRTTFNFIPPLLEKRISYFYGASLEQLKIVCDELKHWDFDTVQHSFCSAIQEDVDFVQYAFGVMGVRTSINYDNRIGKVTSRCLLSESPPLVTLAGAPKTPINKVKSVDGFMYGIHSDTGYIITRRMGRIAVGASV